MQKQTKVSCAIRAGPWALALLVAACSGGGAAPSPPPAPPPEPVGGLSAVDFTATVAAANNIDRRTIAFAPVVPASVTPARWRWDFGDDSPPSLERAPVHRYRASRTYTVEMSLTDTQGRVATARHRVYPHDSGDTLRPLQWYLRNDTISPYLGTVNFDGRLIFAASDGTALARAGEDIRAIDHIQACGVLDTCRGEGIVVQVVDRAAQLTHPDLADNTRQRLSRNLMPNPLDPVDSFSEYQLASPLSRLPFSSARAELIQRNRTLAHGTEVAGIILARDLNGRGIAGIAPRAELASYNYLDSQTNEARVRALAATGIDVSNNSWSPMGSVATGGIPIEYLELPSVVRDGLEQAMRSTRSGLGRLFFKAAGNNGLDSTLRGRLFGNRYNASADSFQSSRYVMAVGAINADGRTTGASEGGANVLTVGYANYRCGRTTIFPPISFSNPIAIVSTDLTGEFGATYTRPGHLFGQNPQAPSLFEPPADILDYTYCFGGTSAATPMASGAGALLLQARPDLSWRDVRAILISSARRNDPDDSGWTTNGAGFQTHYLYGFGALNISRALSTARLWRNYPEEIAYDSGEISVNRVVPDCSNNCTDNPPAAQNGSSFQVQTSPGVHIENLETVQVGVQLRFVNPNSPALSRLLRGTVEVALEHIGPDGVVLSRSVLHKYHPYYFNYLSAGDTVLDAQSATLDWTFLSLRHFGEASSGIWRLRVTDYVNDGSQITLENWRLIMHGH